MAEEQKPEEKQFEEKKQSFDRKNKRKDEQAGEEVKKGAIFFTNSWSARVEEIIGRTGMRGEATQVRCKILEGKDQNKIIVRNVKGPVQLGDLLMLRETEIEAKQLSKGGRGSSS